MNPYNTFWRRAGAQLIDTVIFIPPFVLVGIAAILLSSDDPDPRIFGLASFSVPIYRIVMHRVWGKTVGKMAAGIIVVDADSRGRITWFQSLGREAPTIALLGLALAVGDEEGPGSTLNGLWIVADFIAVLARGDRRALHDLLAGTVALRTDATSVAVTQSPLRPPAHVPPPPEQPFANFGDTSWPEPPAGFGVTVTPPPAMTLPAAQPEFPGPNAAQWPPLEMPAYPVNYGTPAESTRYQNFWRRFAAAIVDRIILAVASQVLAILVGLGGAANGVVFAVTFLANEAYSVVLVAMRGQTVGKMALGVRVARASDEAPVGWGRALVRRLPTSIITISTLGWLLVALSTSDIDFGDPEAFEDETLPGRIVLAAMAFVFINGGWYLLNLITVSVTDKRQAVYDLLAGTVVVRVESTYDPSRFGPRYPSGAPGDYDQGPPPPRGPRGW